MKKKLIIGLIYVAVVSLIIGIFFLKTEKEKDGFYDVNEDPVIVVPVTIGGGDASWENTMNEVAVAYMNEHPNVKIDIRTSTDVGGVNYTKSLVLEEAMGNLYGIVENKNPEIYIQDGKLAELPKELTDKMLSVKTVNGKIYSVSRYYSSRLVIYNKNIFEKLKIEIPENYEEFLGICEELKTCGYTPLTIGMKDLWHLSTWANGLFKKDVLSQDADWFNHCNEGSVNWTDELPVKMLSEYKNLFDLGYIDSEFINTSDAETIEKITDEKAVMVYSGTWMFSQILKLDPDFEIGCFFLPSDDESSNVNLDDTWQWTVTEDCKETGIYDTAIDFLNFYYSRDEYTSVLQQMNGFSSLKEKFEYEKIDVLKDLEERVGNTYNLAGDIWESTEVPEGFSTIIEENMKSLALGEQSVEETARILNMKWRKDIEE